MLGSNGLVGSSISKTLKDSDLVSDLILSTRKQVNLFSFKETSSLISESSPDIIINSAAKVGGIYANNTKRVWCCCWIQ